MGPSITTRPYVYYRLIALWVICEAMLGGIIHGLKLPVSGLIVGSGAIVCICLIGWYIPVRGAILKATLVVAIFKMTLSPQAPLAAYIAVLFQGVLGEMLFRKRNFYRIGCVVLAVAGLLESGLQRILVLTIVYGNDLWKLINYSLWMIAGYVLVHIVTGIIVGRWVGLLPDKILLWSKQKENRIIVKNNDNLIIRKRQGGLLKKIFLLVWMVMVLLLLQTWLEIGQPILPDTVAVRILIRSSLIVLTWYFLVGPVLIKWLHRWLEREKTALKYEVQSVLYVLPATQSLVKQSIQLSANEKGIKRWKRCLRLILVNAVYPNQTLILSAPKQSGKTTSLVAWSALRGDVYGILTPVVGGKRVFMNAHTGEQFKMEAAAGEEGIAVGRFIFSRPGFKRAIDIIRQSHQQHGWLIIDEVGPLELRGEGFSEIVKEAMTYPSNLILVLREGLAEKVIAYFQLTDVRVMTQWEVD